MSSRHRRRRRHHEDHHHHHRHDHHFPWSCTYILQSMSCTTRTSPPRDRVGFSPPPPSCFWGSWSCTTGSPPVRDPGASSKFLIPLLFSYTNMSCIVMFHSLLSKLLCVKNKYYGGFLGAPWRSGALSSRLFRV